MRTFVISATALLLVAAMLLSLTGCNNTKQEVQNVLAEFEYACNTLDFDAVLNCIHPKKADKIKMAADVVGMFTETDNDELFEKLAEYMADGEIGGAGFFSSIKIKVEDIETGEETAVAHTVLTYNLTGDDVVREADFHCEYYAGKWYISQYVIT